ncbi:cysteine desulfurase [Frankia sp. CcI49]|uniref:cysteine desulfurase family protein n=1 Tax=unclassified Frankia TaxID=2632575 RepID=UPI0006C9FDD4|nr:MULTISPECIES: cysteine desulfurase family protein [unclassified Frankia]KPM51064.1 cysteine desulfurase [Frankia sp. R43]ONH60973.1 cysteine desulfurase [Frankia sp. CcI49]
MIYLDHNATTPVDPRVLDAMLPLLTEQFANPASKHGPGQEVTRIVERARREVATLAGARARDVVFTSGATEAANLAIGGALAALTAAGSGRRRVLVGATEHPAVLGAADAAAAASAGPGAGSGTLAERIAVHPDGTIDVDDLRRRLGPDVALVAVMAANNETGAVNDLRPLVEPVHAAGALLFSDITQALGRIPVSLDRTGVDVAVASAHKLYGPKGVGALIASKDAWARIAPQTHGGGQERGRRPGTLNTAGIAGFGAAARLAAASMTDDGNRQRALVALLTELLVKRLGRGAVELNGPVRARLPNTVNLRFVGAGADEVQACLPHVAVSAGSACSGGGDTPSHVLLAMGRTATEARESLRFSLGRATTPEEIRTVADQVARAVQRVRSLTQSTPIQDEVRDDNRARTARPAGTPA